MANEVITYYSKNPPNKMALENFDVKFSEENRSCSDDITVYLKIDDNKIMDIHSVAMAKCLAFLMDKRSNDLINLIT